MGVSGLSTWIRWIGRRTSTEREDSPALIVTRTLLPIHILSADFRRMIVLFAIPKNAKNSYALSMLFNIAPKRSLTVLTVTPNTVSGYRMIRRRASRSTRWLPCVLRVTPQRLHRQHHWTDSSSSGYRGTRRRTFQLSTV